MEGNSFEINDLGLGVIQAALELSAAPEKGGNQIRVAVLERFQAQPDLSQAALEVIDISVSARGWDQFAGFLVG
jgi:hypothetical protein